MRVFLADEEEDDHVDRLNEIIVLANTHNQLRNLPMIPYHEPTYESKPVTAHRMFNQQIIPIHKVKLEEAISNLKHGHPKGKRRALRLGE